MLYTCTQGALAGLEEYISHNSESTSTIIISILYTCKVAINYKQYYVQAAGPQCAVVLSINTKP